MRVESNRNCGSCSASSISAECAWFALFLEPKSSLILNIACSQIDGSWRRKRAVRPSWALSLGGCTEGTILTLSGLVVTSGQRVLSSSCSSTSSSTRCVGVQSSNLFASRLSGLVLICAWRAKSSWTSADTEAASWASCASGATCCS